MTLASSTRLGPHEILTLLGSGGMGEVYRVKDTKLACDAAIKVLPGAPAVCGVESSRASKRRLVSSFPFR